MEKRSELNAGLKEAMKSQDSTALLTIRLILAAMKDKDIAARAKGQSQGISDTEILSMLQSMIKQRNESISMYRKAGREDLATREESEIVIIQRFLPEQISGEALSALIAEIIVQSDSKDIKDMGKVMAVLRDKYAGQADMAEAGAIVKQKLG